MLRRPMNTEQIDLKQVVSPSVSVEKIRRLEKEAFGTVASEPVKMEQGTYQKKELGHKRSQDSKCLWVSSYSPFPSLSRGVGGRDIGAGQP